MNYDSLLKELTIGLQEAGLKNMGDATIDPESQKARDEAMANLAKPIAKAIRNGVNFDIKGVATCAEISEMTSAGDVNDGDVWGVSDSGDVTQPDGSSLRVSAGDLLLFDGEKWNVFLHIDLSNYATKVELQNAVNLLSQLISSHTSRTDNPHQVTAHQVGAYTQQETDSKVSEEAETRAAADEDLAQQIEDSRVEVDENLDPESTNPVENRAVTEAMGGKQDQLIEMTDEEVNELVNSL